MTIAFLLSLSVNVTFDTVVMLTPVQEKDIDDVKGLLVDTEMSILLCTFIVSAFHILFDCLAFKNDVAYWRQERLKKSDRS